MKISLIGILLILLLNSQQLFAQTKKLNMGIGFKGGLSQSLEYKSSDNISTELFTPFISYSVVAYGMWNFKKGDDERDPVFPHLRISLSASSREGVFDIGGEPTRVSFSYLDLDMMLPINFRVSNELNFYFAVGGNASLLVKQTKETQRANLFQPGLLAEMGISTVRGSYFAFQVMGSYSDYSIQTIGVTFGVSIEEAKASKGF